MRRRRLSGAMALGWLAGCSTPPAPEPERAALLGPPVPVPVPVPVPDPVPPIDLPPPAPREFRGAWVATVANIDWPSKPGLPAETQRTEALSLLDRARNLGLNALILQVRPAGDAIYASALEPWSEVLSGEQGRPPWLAGEAAWDPLAFWVDQAHRRGLELHAWFNPYRARHASAKSPLVAPHLGVRRPELVKRYGDQLWMDPGEPAAANHTLAVVADVLRRYDIDGVHIDDYFYPYPVAGVGPAPGAAPGALAAAGAAAPEQPFPDEESWARYQLSGGILARDDWRRANVDALVQALYRRVHEVKPTARLGISPFGIGRPDRRPPGITGFSQFDKLYADAERWLENGWLDYWAPQLYWQINREGLQFPVLLDYWLSLNPLRRHVWPGLFTSQVGKPGWPARELLDQVDVLRSRPAAGGHIHFSLVALAQDREALATQLALGAYAQPALVPATPWLPADAPAAPVLRRVGERLRIEQGAGAARWAVWRRIAGRWQFAVHGLAETVVERPEGTEIVSVQAVGATGRLSVAALWRAGP